MERKKKGNKRNKGRKKAGILVLLIAGILLGICSCHPSGAEEKNAEGAQQETEEKQEAQEKKPEENKKEKPVEPTEGEEGKKPAMEIAGLGEEQLQILGVSRKEVADALKSWTEKNGYSSAAGAEFYEPMVIRFSESKYTMECRLIMEEKGNGIQEADAQPPVISMDYYKGKGGFQFHR